MTPEEEITRTKIYLGMNKPFYGYIAFDTPMISDKNVKTLETDGLHIWYNPDYVSTLTQNKIRGVLAHEILHIQLMHMLRLSGRNEDKWNTACDYVINLILKTEGFELTEGCFLDFKYQGMDAETVYNLLPDEPQKSKQNQSNGNGDPKPSKDFGGCGSFKQPTDENGKELSDAEMQKTEQDIRVKVSQSVQMAKRQGKMPDGLEKLVSTVLEPRIDWKEKLRRLLNAFSKDDFRWFPPNRRFVSRGIYLPSCKSETLPPIVVAIDSSGSTWGLINEFAAELNSICMQYPISEIILMYCDSQIKGDPEVYTQYDLPIQIKMKGGGGTDFRPVFEWIGNNKEDIGVLIYLTDCSGSFPSFEPSYSTIWVKYGNGRTFPNFGEVVEVKEW